MKNDWLTIPDAPNYEINSQLICRNRKTKKLLTLQQHGKQNCYYFSLSAPRRTGTVKRSPKTFRAQAEAAANEGTFESIPSLGGRYEINEKGVVRNAKTKRVISPRDNGKWVTLQIGKKYFSRSIDDLLWEVHGRIIKRHYRTQPCFIENAHGKIFFESLIACARFLASNFFYSVYYFRNLLHERREQIAEWKISYPPKDLSGNVKWNSKGLTALANRQAKRERTIQNGLR